MKRRHSQTEAQNAGGRQMNDEQSSMLGDTSSGQNINNEGPSSSFSTSDSSSDQFSSEGASFSTSANQSGSAGLGSSGEYSNVGQRDDSNRGEFENVGNVNEGSTNQYREDERKQGGGGRQMGDGSATMSGEQSSEPNINNEFSSSTGDGSFGATQGSSSALGGTGNRNDNSSDEDQRGQFEGGGAYEGVKGYGLAPVEKEQPQTGDFA
ncbi:hypothetical protein OIO90_004085 [Microbotryomycetes sp. JL221]|nr:hypothetical protein OIO90_004085 [Microbotryomycetes sp. JL221]